MLLAGSIGSTHAAVLDFEVIAGVTPVEGMSVSNQFKAQFGMSFRRVDGGFPTIGRKGVPASSIVVKATNPYTYDTVLPEDPRADEFGDFFLSDDGVVGGTKAFIIDFSEAVSEASGYIIDIDNKERIAITAYSDDGKTELARLVIADGDPETGDGRSTKWSFQRTRKDIRQIRFRETSPDTQNAEMMFDNFSTDFVPPLPTNASLTVHVYAGLTILGEVGRQYRIEAAEHLEVDPSAEAAWLPVTNFFLPASPFLFIDVASTNSTTRFYRAVGVR